MNREDLIYLCRNMAELSNTPIRLYQKNEPDIFLSLSQFPCDPLLPDRDLKDQSDTHIFYFVASCFSYYGVINFPEGQIVIGPVNEIAISDNDLHMLALHCGVEKKELSSFVGCMQTIPHMPLNSMLLMLCSINFELNHEKLGLMDVSISQADQEYLSQAEFRKEIAYDRDDDPLHNTYQIEQQMLSMVREGNLEAIENWIRNAPAFRSGILAADQLRQAKNTFIVSATLISRAAIEGGLSPQDAFTLSDAYIQHCESVHLPIELSNLSYHMIHDFTERVMKLKCDVSSPLAMKVATYVQQNLSHQITTDDIAKALFLSRPYLSARFHEETGISLSDFISTRKAEEAKRLLLGSDQSIALIAEYLGFSSASHFTSFFRRIVGVTPSAFRMHSQISSHHA